ncbi:hypothetical protein HDV00_002361 [Rhizophlyctis rosea]|nr:hypothetical protein HDV00_002361 [Rhizophlyctis rosea]
MRIAKKVKSEVLAANAWHHRTDAAASVVALVGVGGAVMGVPWVDPVGGLVVAAMTVKAGLDSGIPGVRSLLDASAEPEVVEEIHGTVDTLIKMDDNIQSFDTLRVRRMGPVLFVDLQLKVKPFISVSHAHQIAENLRHGMFQRVSGIGEISIHIDTEDHDHLHRPATTGRPTSEVEAEISRRALEGMEGRVKRLTHVMTHYSSDGIAVHAEILPARVDISYRDAVEIAREVEKRLEGVEGVVSADVHLETSEDGEHWK